MPVATHTREAIVPPALMPIVIGTSSSRRRANRRNLKLVPAQRNEGSATRAFPVAPGQDAPWKLCSQCVQEPLIVPRLQKFQPVRVIQFKRDFNCVFRANGRLIIVKHGATW